MIPVWRELRVCERAVSDGGRCRALSMAGLKSNPCPLSGHVGHILGPCDTKFAQSIAWTQGDEGAGAAQVQRGLTLIRKLYRVEKQARA